MASKFSNTIEICKNPHEVFAFLDDFANAHKWLSYCKSLTKIGSGPNQAKDKLRYVYDDNGKDGIMDGAILKHIVPESLMFEMSDKMFKISLELQLVPIQNGTKLSSSMKITPKSIMAGMMSAIINAALPSQSKSDLVKLKSLIEALHK